MTADSARMDAGMRRTDEDSPTCSISAIWRRPNWDRGTKLTERPLFMFMNWDNSLKFTIEIFTIDSDGSETLLHRTRITAITPLGARKEASRLLAAWKNRHANSARVLNVHGDALYSWRE